MQVLTMAIASTCIIVLAVRISTLLVHLKKQKTLASDWLTSV